LGSFFFFSVFLIGFLADPLLGLEELVLQRVCGILEPKLRGIEMIDGRIAGEL
jgi:hypothetical protein